MVLIKFEGVKIVRKKQLNIRVAIDLDKAMQWECIRRELTREQLVVEALISHYAPWGDVAGLLQSYGWADLWDAAVSADSELAQWVEDGDLDYSPAYLLAYYMALYFGRYGREFAPVIKDAD